MKDVHRSRGYFLVLKGSPMDVDQGKGKVTWARRDAPAKEKENTEDRAKERARGDVPDHGFCGQGPQWARDCPSHHGGKGKRTVLHLAGGTRTLHRFDKLNLEGDGRDWNTRRCFWQLRFPSLQNFVSFEPSKGSSFSTLEPRCPWEVSIFSQRFQEIYADAGLQLTSHPVSPLRFSFANG